MINLDYKMINEENSISMEFDNVDECTEFLSDVFDINTLSFTGDLLRNDYSNIEVMVIRINDNVVFDYLR